MADDVPASVSYRAKNQIGGIYASHGAVAAACVSETAPRDMVTVMRSVVVIAATSSTWRTAADRANSRGPTSARHALTRATTDRNTKMPAADAATRWAA